MTQTQGRTLRSRSRPLMELLERRELLAAFAGSLDPTFAGRGYTLVSVINHQSPEAQFGVNVLGVFALPGGKVEVASSESEGVGPPFTVISESSTTVSLALQRYNADGTSDTTFNPTGLGAATTGTVSFFDQGSFFTRAVMQADGKIIAVGTMVTGLANSDSTFLAIRFNLDGSLDTTYGDNGVAELPTSVTSSSVPQLNQVSAAVLQPNGDLVLVGNSNSGTSSSLAAVRLTPSGTLDPTFGTAGTATFGSGQITQVDQVAVQPDGGIILAGTTIENLGLASTSDQLVVLRLNPDGTPDTTFGGPSASGGVVALPQSPFNPSNQFPNVAGLAVQPDNKILASTDASVADAPPVNADLVRLNADGTLDTGFGQGGVVTPGLAGPVAIQGDGSIVVAGSLVTHQGTVSNGPPTRTTFAATLVGPTGSLGGPFGNSPIYGLGVYSFGASTLSATPTAIAIDAGGNLLLAGSTTNVTPSSGFYPPTDIALMRAIGQLTDATATPTPPPPTPPASFDGSGKTNPAVYIPSIGAFAYQTNGSTIVIPFGLGGAGQTLPAAADYAGIGYTQIAAYLPSLGDYAIRPAGGGPDLVFPFGIAGAGQSIPVPADYEGTGRADIAVYMPALGAFGIRPSTGGPDRIVPFGIPGANQSIPVPADYTGDGKADLAVYLPSLGAFGIRPSGGGPDQIIPFGIKGAGMSIPAPGDYDGSGRTELAVYIPSQGKLIYRPANGGPDVSIPFGLKNAGEIPAPGDYSGSGVTEPALYNPATAAFTYRPAGGGADVTVVIGLPGAGNSIPVTAAQPLVTAPTTPAKAVKAKALATSSKVHAAAIPGGPLVKSSKSRQVATALPKTNP